MHETNVQHPKLTVARFFEENRNKARLVRLDSEGDLDRTIKEAALHRPGLALAGFVEKFTAQRVQICGNTETTYLNKLKEKELTTTLERVFSFPIPCFIFTHNQQPPQIFLDLAQKHRICVFQTEHPTISVHHILGSALQDVFAPRTHLHGTLVDVYGVGILLMGKSGIGKTEVALDLVKRGHRLVADDIVTVMKKVDGILIGSCNEKLRHNMEIRGVGIIDVQAVFGIRGIRMKKRIEALVELKEWSEADDFERVGLKESSCAILGEQIPKLQLAVFPGKTIAVIVEVIALNLLLKLYGFNAARNLDEYLQQEDFSKFRDILSKLNNDFE